MHSERRGIIRTLQLTIRMQYYSGFIESEGVIGIRETKLLVVPYTYGFLYDSACTFDAIVHDMRTYGAAVCGLPI